MSSINIRGNLEQKAYDQIKQMIIDCELVPGDQVIQDQLAKKIGISRTPLRQAITQMERDLYLEITPQGIFVRDLNESFMKSVWEVRSVLEGLACRLAASKINSATIIYLRALFEEAYEEAKKGNQEPYREADIIFHKKILELSENMFLKQNIDHTKVLDIAFNQGLLRPPSETFGEHMEIIQSLENKDSNNAEQLMVEHLRKSINVLHSQSKKA
ncbi:GntR family transcriptional regulator [Virgibacillus sp. JSM 102003]|uniref:GntR family transcriptional regulator n=1 Tax=Virgibacillus sp. JSM 102003 TaxID=1562108 RepID=UPI0035BFFFB2